MKKVDTNYIKEMTNQMIGYNNFKMEENMKKKKLKNITFVLMGILFLGSGIVTVNALTDNAIVDTINDVIPVRVVSKKEEEKNAVCKKTDDNHINCTIDWKDVKSGEEIKQNTDELIYYFINKEIDNEKELTFTIEAEYEESEK